MNAAKSNASLDRQEEVGKVKPARRERAAVHRRQGATVPPSLPRSLFLFLFFFYSCIPLIYLFIYLVASVFFSLLFISNSPPLLSVLEEATALTRCGGHKERATEIKRHGYSENISISPKEYQLN